MWSHIQGNNVDIYFNYSLFVRHILDEQRQND